MPELKIHAGSLELQERDIALLRGLLESRLMTSAQVAALYFEGRREYAKKRLQKIKAAGLVGERLRRKNEPSILFLTRKAFALLNTHGRLSEFPVLSANSFEARSSVSELTLRHELEIMDVKAAFHSALAKSDKFSIVQFQTWPLLYQFQISRPGSGADTPVKPDGFIRIHEKEAGTNGFIHECFLEVDRSSKDHIRLTSQAACYLDYYRNGGFAIRNGASRTDFKAFPFRTLFVLKSIERRNNLAERLAYGTPPILTQAWLATYDDVTAHPLGPIWVIPGDYRDAIKGTRFSKDFSTRAFEYIRNPAREAFVESNVKKRYLLGNGIAA